MWEKYTSPAEVLGFWLTIDGCSTLEPHSLSPVSLTLNP